MSGRIRVVALDDHEFILASLAELMNREPRTIGAEALAGEALRAMNEGARRVTTLFVVDADGRAQGILHVHDLLRAGVA